MNHSEAYVGMKVYFGRRNGQKTLGEITKVNKKNLKVKQLEERGVQRNYSTGQVWTVPPALCTPAEGGRPAAPQERPCLVNVITGKRTYGQPGEDSEQLFERMANRY